MPRGVYYRVDSKAKKDTVEDGLTLSISTFRKGIREIIEGRAGGWTGISNWSNTVTGARIATIGYSVRESSGVPVVWLDYKKGDEPLTYPVYLTSVCPNYGGRRWYFICPLAGCGRRVACLYLAPGARYFGCRQCCNLTYQSTREALSDRVDSRLYKVRRRMRAEGEVTGGILDPIPPRRRYMHLKTYGRLMREYYNLLDLRDLAYYAGLIRIMGSMPNRFVPDDMPPMEEGARLVKRAESEYRAHRLDRYRIPDRFYRMASSLPDGDEEREPPTRFTLGEVAKAAGVPFAFALEAQREGLIRADSGRGTRWRGYRPKLVSWLKKLHVLRASGFGWEELKVWVRRRWKPGYEDERQQPRRL
jgi:hypothetical protein